MEPTPTESDASAPTPSEFRIEAEVRAAYIQNVTKPTDADEIEMRRAITAWAEKKSPGLAQWMYFWN